MGADGKFDLRVVETVPSSESTGESSSSTPSEEGHSEEGPSTEEPEVTSLEKPQDESSSTSQNVDVSSEVLVEAVRVEEIPDEGIFTSEDIIDMPGDIVVVSEASVEPTPSADHSKETVTVGEIHEVTEEGEVTSKPANPPSETPTSSNTTSTNISVGETARR